jgi:hypothetical protein
LQDQFKIIADTGMPAVWVVSRNESEIVFGFIAVMVHRQEVINAAGKYCGYKHKNAALEGYSRHCVFIDRYAGYITLAIMALSCN